MFGIVLLAASCGRTSHGTPSADGDGGSSGERGDAGATTGGSPEPLEGGAPGDAGTSGDEEGTPSTNGGTGNASGGSAGADTDTGAVGGTAGTTDDAGGTTGDAGAGGSTGGAGTGGGAGVPPLGSSCVYTGPAPVDPALGLLLDGEDLKAKLEPGCELRLGRRVPLPVNANYGKLVFQYDLNQDGIHDLFFAEASAVGSTRSLRILRSDPYSDEVKFEPVDCEVPIDLPYTRIFARHIDDDEAADWIVGTPSGVKVFANREEGLLEVGSYDFGDAVDSLTLEAVAALGVDGTPVKQLAVRYTLVRDGELERGILTFQHAPSSTTTTSELEYQARVQSPSRGSGSVALVASTGGSEAVLGLDLREANPRGWLWNGWFEHFVSLPDDGLGTPELVRPAVFDSTPAIAVGFPRHFAFYEIASNGSQLAELGAVETAFTTAETAPGEPPHSRRLVLDLDRDGDSELVEIGGDDGSELVVSFQEDAGVFDQRAPIALGPFPTERKDEDTFLQIGTTQSRVLVRDAEVHDEPEPPALQALLCTPP
ncbi:MAG: hypothetical protein DIU78_020555 [Pseudomonadota bacterium]